MIEVVPASTFFSKVSFVVIKCVTPSVTSFEKVPPWALIHCAILSPLTGNLPMAQAWIFLNVFPMVSRCDGELEFRESENEIRGQGQRAERS
jgi:hypothetical protein